MPTLAQLQAESWWNREVITPELRWLATEICSRTKRPLVAAGTKGDRFHLNGAHRSQEWIKNSRWCTDRSYTVQAGLTSEQARQIAGFDFTPGSAEAMIAQSKRLMAALKAGRLEEVREFYGNVDGNRIVDGWDNLRDRAATSDDTHLWHWHLSIDRRKLRDRKLMERILAAALGLEGTTEEDDVELTDRVNLWDEKNKRPWRAGKTIGVTAKDPDVTVAQLLQWGGEVGHLTHNRVLPLLEAILAAVKGADARAILARVNQLAEDEAARDAGARAELLELLEQASVERAEIAELVGRGLSGEVDAAEVVRLLGEKLTAASDHG